MDSYIRYMHIHECICMCGGLRPATAIKKTTRWARWGVSRPPRCCPMLPPGGTRDIPPFNLLTRALHACNPHWALLTTVPPPTHTPTLQQHGRNARRINGPDPRGGCLWKDIDLGHSARLSSGKELKIGDALLQGKLAIDPGSTPRGAQR